MQTLEATGQYQAITVKSAEEAILLSRQIKFSLAIVDTNAFIGSLSTLAGGLRLLLPDIRLLVIPPTNEFEKAILPQLTPDGYLSKSFLIPTLLDSVAGVLSNSLPLIPHRAMPPEASSPTPLPSSTNGSTPDWLQDVSLAAQHLTRLSLESSARAALIMRQDQLWAYAGELSQDAAQELAAKVLTYWIHDRMQPLGSNTPVGKSPDIVRFVRLNTTAEEYLLYATALGKSMVLALAFDAITPFSVIRSQAGQLTRALSTRSTGDLSTTPPAPASPHPRGVQPDESARHSSSVRPLLPDVPPPMPAGLRPQVPPEPLHKPLSNLGIKKLAHAQGSEESARLDSQAIELPSLSETRPHQAVSVDLHEEFRPISPTLHSLYYACLFIPRLPSHHITGDLAAQLSEWMGQLNLAFGWRLEYLSIRPETMLWVVNVSPSTSPSHWIRVLRQQTSQRIFNRFPHLALENPSGDFWAPGYLIISGAQPPSAQIIRDFIQQTRRHQGAKLTNPIST